MRRLYLYITFLMYFVLNAKAQTPFDLFAPDVSRSMLQLEPKTLKDTVSGKTISNLQKEQIKDDIRKWLSVDPLADKYPGISPYAYCAWNPIKYVDPDGKDYTINIDNETNTMTITAKYYVNPHDAESAQQSIDFWNNQSGNFAYESKRKQYKIFFNLQTEITNNVSNALNNDPANDANAYAVRPFKDTNISGRCFSGNQVLVSPQYQWGETGAHEIGHTLGMEHTNIGIMTQGLDSWGRKSEVSKMSLEQCIFNAFGRFPNSSGAKGLINGEINKYGKVIKLP